MGGQYPRPRAACVESADESAADLGRRQAALRLVRRRSALRRLPRSRVGLPRALGPAPVREGVPGGLPVGPLLADHPEEARELPRALRRLRLRARDVTRLLGDAGIVRHRGKIESTVNNARRALELVEEAGSLRAFFAQWRRDRPYPGVVAESPESKALSKELKRRGWSFVGPTTM